MNTEEISFLKELVLLLDKNILQTIVVMICSIFLLKYAWTPIKDFFTGVTTFIYRCGNGISKFICKGVHLYLWHKKRIEKEKEDTKHKIEKQIIEILKTTTENSVKQNSILDKLSENQREIKESQKEIMQLLTGLKR